MRNFLLASACALTLLLSPAVAEDPRLLVAPGSVTHVLNKGDDPESVARLYGVSSSQLRQANRELSWTEGELVVIPGPQGGRAWPTHLVRAGETLWRIGKGYGISVEQLRQANGMGSDNTLLPGNVLRLPRAEKPVWSEPTPAPAASPMTTSPAVLSASESFGTAAPNRASEPARPPAALSGQWVEVRLPDNRRAWAPVSQLVVGSWQPQAAEQVVALGRQFVGVPYRWGGVDPNGWDCSGYVQEIFRLGGHQVPRLADAQFEACVRVETPEVGDLVFFNTDGSGVSHVGIYTGDGKFLHASSSRGVVEDRLEDSYFASRYLGAGRLPAWSSKSEEQLAGSSGWESGTTP